MKKITLTLFSFVLTFSMFAGGLVTNTNQSAAWTRMLNRNATVEIDAVYYNPAALTKLEDGFHLSVNNQIIGQTKSVTNSALNGGQGKTYEGDVFAPVFPGLYAAYKTGKMAFSFGFNPIGGGGSAEFADGLPSFELPVASLATSLAEATQGDVTGYSMSASLTGSSVYYGIQAGISYEINDMLSVYAGARYVIVKNTYEGTLKDIMFATTSAGAVRADTYMNGLAAQASDAATSATGAATSMQPIIDNGGGGYTLDQLVAAGQMTQEQADALNAGYTALGGDPTGLTAAEMQAGFNTFATTYTTQAAQLTAGAALMGDKELDAEQTGSGITPIIGVNLSLMEDRLNIGVKYEFMTNLTVTNSTAKDVVVGIDPTTGDPITMFPDGEEVNADIPALLTLGVSYKVTDALRIEADFDTYFDKAVGWKRTDPFTGNEITADDFIDKGYMQYGLGLEYTLSDAFLLSAGWTATQTGVKDNYHSDLSYSLNTNTFGGGIAYKFNDMIKLNLGGFYTMYADKTVQYPVSATEFYSQTYDTKTWGIGLGLDFSF